MDELKQMKQVLNPTEVFLVVDAMTGQEAACKIPYSLQICLSVSILDASFNTLMPHSSNIFQGFCKLRVHGALLQLVPISIVSQLFLFYLLVYRYVNFSHHLWLLFSSSSKLHFDILFYSMNNRELLRVFVLRVH